MTQEGVPYDRCPTLLTNFKRKTQLVVYKRAVKEHTKKHGRLFEVRKDAFDVNGTLRPDLSSLHFIGEPSDKGPEKVDPFWVIFDELKKSVLDRA